MMNRRAQNVKIIGAGVAGLTVAAELVEAGLSVEIHDKSDALGSEACSWYAGGMLAPWCERENADEAVARLGAEAIDWWEKRTSTVDRAGSLVVAPPRDAADLTRFSKRTNHFEWIASDAITTLEPDLEGRFRKALYFGDEAHLNPRLALQALYQYLIERGVTFHFQSDGTDAPSTALTINATGFNARHRLDELRGIKGEMLIIRTPEVSLSRPVRMLHPRIPIYIVPRADHHFMVGATMIESAERSKISARSMIELLSAAYALHPAFGEAEIVEIGTDVRPAYPDNLPRITKQDGVFYVNGLYRHGFLLAPALARMTREVILEDQHPEFYHSSESNHEADRQRASA